MFSLLFLVIDMSFSYSYPPFLLARSRVSHSLWYNGNHNALGLSFFPPHFRAAVIVCNYYNSQAAFGVGFGFGFGYGPAGGGGWPAAAAGLSTPPDPPAREEKTRTECLDFLHIKSMFFFVSPACLSVCWFRGMTSINTFRLFVGCHLALVFGFSWSLFFRLFPLPPLPCFMTLCRRVDNCHVALPGLSSILSVDRSGVRKLRVFVWLSVSGFDLFGSMTHVGVPIW